MRSYALNLHGPQRQHTMLDNNLLQATELHITLSTNLTWLTCPSDDFPTPQHSCVFCTG